MFRAQVQILMCLLSFPAMALSPRVWRRPVLDRVARQLVFSGWDALPLLIVMGLGIGGLAALQGALWLDYTKRADLLFPVLNAGIVREVAPALSVMLGLAASGAPMCTEMAMMRVNREVALLRCFGIDPYHFLVLPRMIGLALAVMCGAVVVTGAALTGCAVVLAPLVGSSEVSDIWSRLLSDLSWRDTLWMMLKASTGGCIIAAVACTVGLSAGEARTEVPRMVAAGMMTAGAWLTFTGILFTWVIYT